MAAFVTGRPPPSGSGTSDSPSGLAGAVGLGPDPWAAVCARSSSGSKAKVLMRPRPPAAVSVRHTLSHSRDQLFIDFIF